MNTLRMLLLATLILVVFSSNSAEATEVKEPKWYYTAGGSFYSVSISADGEYIAAASYDNKIYLFDKDSSTPLWSYTLTGEVKSLAISADGEYIVTGSKYDRVYLFDKDILST